jgi:hypothetical protein
MFFDGNQSLYSESFFKRNDLINDYFVKNEENFWINACNSAETQTKSHKDIVEKRNKVLDSMIEEMNTPEGQKKLNDAIDRRLKDQEDSFNNTTYSMIKKVLDYLVDNPKYCFDDESLMYEDDPPVDCDTYCKVFTWLMKEGDFTKSEYDNSSDEPNNPFETYVKAYLYKDTLIIARLMFGQGSSLQMWTSNRETMTKEESDFEHSLKQNKIIDDGSTFKVEQ